MLLLPRLLARLDVRPGEERVTLLFIALSFSQGWALVLADTATMALFLSSLGANAMPGIYLCAAVVVPLTGAAFGWLGQRISPERMAVGALITLLLLMLLFWSASAIGVGAFFLLLIWYRIFSALAGVIFWGLAGHLLHVRQAKRLYGLISSGENMSRVLGYALVPILISLIGVADLLALAGIGFIGALAAVLAMQRISIGIRTPQPVSSLHRPTSVGGLRALLTNPYTLLILALIALSNWAYSTLDLTFVSQVHLRFEDTNALAGFLAQIALLLSILRLIGRPLLTGRLIGRYGVAFALLAQPAVLCLGALLITGAAGSDPTLIFWMVVGIRLIDSTLSTIFSRPALQILFQPLPAAQRLAAQSAADGIVAPIALGIVGLVGLVLGNVGTLTFALILLGVGFFWLLVARRVGRSYLGALGRQITHRIGLSGANLTDPAALARVRQALASPHSGEVLYAIELLSEHMPAALEQVQSTLLSHADPGVRRAILAQIGAGRLHPRQHELVALLGNEPDLATRAAVIRALCATAEADAVDLVAPFVHDPAPEICRSALVGLLRHGGIAGILAGGQRLLNLVESSNPAERILAATIVGELGAIEFFHPLRRLFSDPDPAVRRAVLLAAGQIGNVRLLDDQIAALADRSTAAAAATGLERSGPIAVPALAATFNKAALPERIRIAAILSRIGGDQAIATLRGAINHPDADLRRTVYAGLVACGYRASGAERALIHERIRNEAEQAAWLLAAVADLGDAPAKMLLESLTGDVERCRERILNLLAVAANAQAIAAVRTSLTQGTPDRRAYAVEIIDVLLPPELKAAVLPLFDDLAPPVRLQRLDEHFPQPALGRTARLIQIATLAAPPIGAWSRCCALHYAVAEGALQEPNSAAAELARVGRATALSNVPLFAATPGEILADIAERMVALQLPAGTQIFAQGDAGHFLFILAAGAVRIHADGQTLNVMQAGEVFGEMAVLDPAPRAATADVIETALLLRLDRSDLDAIFDECPEVARSLIRTLTRNLRDNVATLAGLRAQLDAARTDHAPDAEPLTPAHHDPAPATQPAPGLAATR